MAKRKKNGDGRELVLRPVKDSENLREAFAGRWMSSRDIDQEDDTILTIKEVYEHPDLDENGEPITDDNGKPKLVKSIAFEEVGQLLWLNKLNGRRIVALFGDKREKWVGKQIAIYFDPEVEYGGRTVGGIRIRARAPKAAPKRRTRSR